MDLLENHGKQRPYVAAAAALLQHLQGLGYGLLGLLGFFDGHRILLLLLWQEGAAGGLGVLAPLSGRRDGKTWINMVITR